MTTTISPLKGAGKIIFLFHRWDMLVSRRVMFLNYLQQLVVSKLLPCLQSIYHVRLHYTTILILIHPQSLTSRPWKMAGWKQILSYWVLVTVQGRTLKLPGGYLPQHMTTSFFLGLASDWWKSSTRAGMCHTEIPSWHSFYRRVDLIYVLVFVGGGFLGNPMYW